MTITHDSDCSLHNEPAIPNGPCDCSARFQVALQAIADMHPGDQPASSGHSEEVWLRLHIGKMRRVAGDALTAKF